MIEYAVPLKVTGIPDGSNFHVHIRQDTRQNRSFDQDRFGQIPRLVDIVALQNAEMIGQQLQRNDFEERLEQDGRRRHGNDIRSFAGNFAVAFRDDSENANSSLRELANVGNGFLIAEDRGSITPIAGGENDDRQMLAHQRRRAVLYLTGWIAFSMN